MLILLAAALLRFVDLSGQGLWLDEALSVEMAQWPTAVLLTVDDGHPPLHPLLIKWLSPWLGSEICGRVISVVAGVATIGLLFLVARRLFDERVALLAATLLTISPLHVWYSREGRMYALLAMWATLSSLLVTRLARRIDAKIVAGYLVVTAAGILTHYAYVGIVAAQGLYLATRLRGRVRVAHGAAIGTLAAASAIVVGRMVLRETVWSPLASTTRGFDALALPYTAFTFIAGFGIGPPLEELHRSTSVATVAAYWPEVAAVVLVAATVGAVAVAGAIRDGSRIAYPLLWLVVPPLSLYVASWLTGIAFNVRYVLASLPALALLLAAGLMRRSPAVRVAAVLALVSISAVSVARDHVDPRYAREDLRGAAAFLETASGEGDRIVVSSGSTKHVLQHYMGHRSMEALPVRPVRTRGEAQRVVAETSRPDHATWIVLSRDWDDDPHGHLSTELTSNDSVRLEARLPGVRVYRTGG